MARTQRLDAASSVHRGCRSARCANFSANKLTELPETIGELTALTTLTLNLNELQELPDAVVFLPNLRVLHASRNQLLKLPRAIGEMQALRELRLDWNCIQELPFSFRALTGLQVLCMEQNPLRLPTSDVVARGVPETLRFMEKALVEFQRSSRREVVEALQQVLAFAAQLIQDDEMREAQPDNSNNTHRNATVDDDLRVITSLFEPNCDRLAPQGTSSELKLYGIVWESFFSELLPAIERKQALAVSAAQQPQTDESRSKQQAPPTPFSQRFSPEEVEDALLNYDDEFGMACVAGGEKFQVSPSSFVAVRVLIQWLCVNEASASGRFVCREQRRIDVNALGDCCARRCSPKSKLKTNSPASTYVPKWLASSRRRRDALSSTSTPPWAWLTLSVQLAFWLTKWFSGVDDCVNSTRST